MAARCQKWSPSLRVSGCPLPNWPGKKGVRHSKPLLAWALVAASGFLGTACSPPRCPELRMPAKSANQPFGGPCESDSDCQSPLRCLEGGFSLTPRFCTRNCSEGCPSSSLSTCSRISEDAGVEAALCFPGCREDSDCVLGTHVAVCSIDPRAATGDCVSIRCTSRPDSCPSGSHCVGETCTEIEGGISELSGWCQRVTP